MKPRGFSLLEVLLALAVAAVVLGALLNAHTQQLSNFSSTRERALARWVAANEFNRLGIEQQTLEPGRSEQRARQGNQEFEIIRIVEPSPLEGFFQVELRIRKPGSKAVLHRSRTVVES